MVRIYKITGTSCLCLYFSCIQLSKFQYIYKWYIYANKYDWFLTSSPIIIECIMFIHMLHLLKKLKILAFCCNCFALLLLATAVIRCSPCPLAVHQLQCLAFGRLTNDQNLRQQRLAARRFICDGIVTIKPYWWGHCVRRLCEDTVVGLIWGKLLSLHAWMDTRQNNLLPKH